MVRSNVKAHKFLCNRDGEHCKANSKPAYLRKADHSAGKIAALGAETAAREHIQREAAFCANEAKRAGVGGKDEASQEEGPYEAPPVKSGGELLSHPHTGGEEGEAKHHHKHT